MRLLGAVAGAAALLGIGLGVLGVGIVQHAADRPAPAASPACVPIRYDTAHDAEPGYWAEWDTLLAAGYHAHVDDPVNELWPAGC